MAATSVLQEYVADKFRCITGEKGNLGEGGFGKVRFAFHDDWTNVALKCFPVMGGPRQKKLIIKQIKKEVETLQQVQNPKIVRVYGWTQWSYGIAIVMEYMPVGSLDNLIFDPYIELAQVLCLKFCCEISDGIVFIHNSVDKKPLIHGDLKPQNILVSSKLCCKIGDFGSAQVTKLTGSTTTTGDVIAHQHFTWLYAAPEYLDKTKPVRPRKEQDTYSFGLIVHGVLSREQPHQLYASTEDYLDAVKRGERPDSEKISELANELPNDEDKKVIAVLESVMKRCWMHHPHERANIVEVRDELQSCLNNQGSDKIKESVEGVVNEIDVFSPTENADYSCETLTHFDPRTGKFDEEPDSAPVISERCGSSIAANQRTEKSNAGISIHAPSSGGLMNTDSFSTTSVPDSAQAISERSGTSMEANQINLKSNAGMSVQGRLTRQAIVTGTRDDDRSGGHNLKFDVHAWQKDCKDFWRIINEALSNDGSKFRFPKENPGAPQQQTVHQHAKGFLWNWTDEDDIKFKAKLLNGCAEIGWEKDGRNDIMHKYGITFRKKY